MTRTRWLGATGVRVPEIAVEGEDLDLTESGGIRIENRGIEALVLGDVDDLDTLVDAHERGVPVVVRATSEEEVAAALARPEVACALVPADRGDLRDLDLRRLKYG